MNISETNKVDKGVFSPVRPDGVLILGQDQDSVGGNFDETQSFSGMLSQVGLWDTMVPKEDIQLMASCKENKEGNIISWNIEADWTLANVTVEEESLEGLCKEPIEIDKYIITEKTSHEEFKYTCDKLTGTIRIPTSPEELITMHDEQRAVIKTLPGGEDSICHISANSSMLIMGQVLSPSRNAWVNPYTNKSLTGDNWVVNKRPTDGSEQCLIIWGHLIEYQACGSRFACGVCQLPQEMILKLKGLCGINRDDEEYDLDYYVFGHKNGKPHYM